MTPINPKQHEVLEIVLVATVGEATEGQLGRLSQLVAADESLALYAVQLLSQEAWLSWHGSQPYADRLLAELQPFASLASSASGEDSGGAPKRPTRAVAEAAFKRHEAREQSAPVHDVSRDRRFSWRGRGWVTSGMAAAALVCFGAVAGGLATRWGLESRPAGVAAVGAATTDANRGTTVYSQSAYAARVVQATPCVWGAGGMPPGFDGKLRSGESINLMEGLAEIEVNLATAGNATLQIEGPARMILTAEGAPSLTFGRFSARVSPGFDDFQFDTPFGQIIVVEDSSLGVAVHGLRVDVHVFSGRAVIASPWTSDGKPVDRYDVRAGESLQLSAEDSAVVSSVRGDADPDVFASQSTMISDQLKIGEEYVRGIEQSSPIVYWRFEDLQNGKIANEIGDTCAGVVVGSPDWPLQANNRVIEFGSGLSDEALRACVESNEPLGSSISESYTVELWVKPSHFHLGTLVSFVRSPPPGGNPGHHGMLLELGGPLTAPSAIEHPGRIRFLHRDPPSDDPSIGTSIFSKSPYKLRRWVYVVAVKEGPQMRLYVNGNLAGTAHDDSQLSGDLTVLIGQLDRHRDWRRFIGQLDELAIYGRALGEGEIRRHFELARPEGPAREAI